MFLVKRVLVMVHAKDYETLSSFVKVVQKSHHGLFSAQGVLTVTSHS